jgi:hypothetical protein
MGLISGGKRRRYYVCRDRDRVHGKYRCHRVMRVEEQFVALLDRLAASPELVGVIVDRGGVAEEQRGLAARLADLRREAADVSAGASASGRRSSQAACAAHRAAASR